MRGRVPHGSPYWMKNLQTDFHGPGSGWQKATNIQARSCGQNYGTYVKRSSTKGKAAMGYRETEARQCKVVERHFFIDPTDAEFKEPWKTHWTSWTFRWKQPCFARSEEVSTGNPEGLLAFARIYACIVEADESARMRMEGSLYKDHEDHTAGKGIKSLNHYNPLHNFIPIPQAMKMPEAKSSSGERMETTRSNTSVAANESQKHERCNRTSKERRQNSRLCFINGSLPSQEFGVGTRTFKQRRPRGTEVTW